MINLPAVVLVVLCVVLLHPWGERVRRGERVMVLIKLSVLVLFAVIAFTAFNADHFDNFCGCRSRRHQRGGRHDLLLLHRSRRRVHRRARR